MCHILRKVKIFRKKQPLVLRNFGNIRILKKTETEFHPKHPAHRFIKKFHTDFSLTYQLRQIFPVKVIDHIHLHTGIESEPCGFLAVRGNTLVDYLLHGIPIRHNETVKLPFFLENFRKRVTVRRSRHSAYKIERAHKRSRTGLYTCLKRRQICIPKALTRNFSRDIITARLRRPIADIMFETCGDSAFGREIISLISPYGRRAIY